MDNFKSHFRCQWTTFNAYSSRTAGNGYLSALSLTHSTDKINGSYFLKVTCPSLHMTPYLYDIWLLVLCLPICLPTNIMSAQLFDVCLPKWSQLLFYVWLSVPMMHGYLDKMMSCYLYDTCLYDICLPVWWNGWLPLRCVVLLSMSPYHSWASLNQNLTALNVNR